MQLDQTKMDNITALDKVNAMLDEIVHTSEEVTRIAKGGDLGSDEMSRALGQLLSVCRNLTDFQESLPE